MSQTNEQRKMVPFAILFVGVILVGHFLGAGPLSGGLNEVEWGLMGLSALGVLYVVTAFYRVHSEHGPSTALNWLFSGDTSSSSGTRGSTQTEKVPPPSENQKNELYFERADRKCEWCDDRIDTPEVHHIKPRADGGSNDPSNLIVLCPNCHRKADGGTLSRSRLKYQVKEQMADWEA